MNVPPAIEPYIRLLTETFAAPDSGVVSAVLFGSASKGGYSSAVSDVDLLIILADRATAQDKCRTRENIADLEKQSGLGKQYLHRRGTLDALADRITNNVRSFFVCTRSDLLSGEPARILGITAAQAVFVDRVTIPSILASAVTFWGEHLLAQVPLPPIRRLDVVKAFFSLFNQALITVLGYPFLSDPTRYAMDTLKRSLHNCYFVYHSHAASLAEEAAFFQKRIGSSAGSTLAQLMKLRTAYQPSFEFTIRCLPALVRLHWVTASENHFPREPRFTTD